MTALLACLPLALVRDLGWTLLHFLWQGLLLAALLNAILPLCRSAVARHNWALATLALMALTPVATFLSLHDFAASGPVIMADTSTTTGSPAPPAADIPWIDLLVLFWLTGVAVLSLRAFGGWYVARSLTRRDTLAISPELLARCQRLQRRLAVTGPVRFLLSRRIQAPLVIGWLRPVVLLPVSALSGLTPQQLDALILHELAHIRRLDTAINVLLVAVETILFYHPATWWVSRQVRIAREQCCDDLAVAACGNAAIYVEALTSLESWKPANIVALAANDGSLKSRATRLLQPSPARRFSLSAVAGLAFLSAIIGSVAVAQTQPRNGSASAKVMTANPTPSRHADSQKAGRPYPSDDKNPVMLQPIEGTHSLPPYPAISARLGETGTTTLAVTIGTDGVPRNAAILKSSGSNRLDQAAMEHVQNVWRWQPPMRNGRPVTATSNVKIVFELGVPKGRAR